MVANEPIRRKAQQAVKSFARPTREVSYRMRMVRSRGTSLERTMEGILRSLHVKYERQPKLLGRPDFRIKERPILVFCDSSFWHGRRKADVTGESFRRNRDFWKSKIVYNKARDTQTNKALRKEGWTVVRFWDTNILKQPEVVKARLRRILDERAS